MKITVAGMGYVGMSNAVLLAQHNQVIAYDIVQEKIDLIDQKKSPIKDDDIERFFKTKELNIKATSIFEVAFDSPDYVIISTPTNFNEETNYFDTNLVELIVKQTTELAPNAVMIIKSTIPVGLTEELSKKYNTNKLYFSPEFLREGKALFDNLYPSRIIVGGRTDEAKKFADLMVEGAEKEDIEVLFVGSTEAEAIKLFSNTYLAMRVSFFNELDSFCIDKNLNARQIINGVSLDPRIGNHYNNPSFGYGGYCLPKDTKQLLSNYSRIPQKLISAIVDSNYVRKTYILSQIISMKVRKVGIYRLIMKSNSDNFRDSAILEIITELDKVKIQIIIYEPTIELDMILGFKNYSDLDEFKSLTDLILANRVSEELLDVSNKVYTRDIFNND